MSAKRFATWFFVGEVTGGEEVADGIETDRLHWFRPVDAFARADAGEIELAPPQYVTLVWLQDHGNVAAVINAADAGEVVDYTPASTSSKATARCASTTKTSPTTTAAASTIPARATASIFATTLGSTSATDRERVYLLGWGVTRR